MIFKYIFFANECDLEYTGEAPMDSQILPWGGGGGEKGFFAKECGLKETGGAPLDFQIPPGGGGGG